MVAKRSSQDPKWVELKKKVRKRDKSCRLMKILSAKEMILLAKHAPRAQLMTCDTAHCFGVGPYPHMCYNIENTVLLNRFSHECLDSFKSPVTGEKIEEREVELWWGRILGGGIYLKLKEESTSHKVKETINESEA